MSTSNTVTKTDLQNIINAIFPATTEDMSQAQIDAFVASLNCQGGFGVQSGETSTISVSSNSYTDVAVVFDNAYSSTPAIMVSFITTSTAGGFGACSVAVNNRSANGFTIRVFNADSTTRQPVVQWIAIGT